MTKFVFTDKHDRFRTALIADRKQANLTRVQVAARLRRPQSFVSKFEKGERRLDVVEFFEVASVIRVDPLRFLRALKLTRSIRSR